MSRDSLIRKLEWVISHWAAIAKGVGVVIAATYFVASLPTKKDLDNVAAQVQQALTEQRAQLAQVKQEVATRLTKAEVVAIVQGSDNPYYGDRQSVQRVVNAYDADREDTRKLLQEILTQLAGLRAINDEARRR